MAGMDSKPVVPEAPIDLDEPPDPFEPEKGCKRPGLKPKALTKQFVYDCARLFLTQEEIGALCGLSQGQVSKRLNSDHEPELREAFIAGHNVAKMSLRRAQYKKAVTEGNLVAQIWLGKQMLGQSDKQESHEQIDVNVTHQYIAAWGKTPQQIASSQDSDLIDSTAEDLDADRSPSEDPLPSPAEP